ncbi:Histone chaperone asf1 [Naganishia albida]|nr:Histone chaperone asf1 [Naganishia albida]
MSIVNIRNIQLLNNPARWEDDYNFRITFECVEELKEDIEWRLLYVGDAKSEEYDQELDSCMVGPVPVGVNSFDFTAAAPQPNLLPSTASEEILGVTVLILTASYRDKEFVRVGYYVNTEYEDEARRLEPPLQVDFKGLVRNVLVDKPKVTRFSVPWDSDSKALSNPWANTVALDSLSTGTSTQQLDAPIGSNGPDNIYDSPLPPPIQAAAPASPMEERAVDVEMA